MDDYYYDYNTKTMYKVCHICSTFNYENKELFIVRNDPHILKLNNLQMS